MISKLPSLYFKYLPYPLSFGIGSGLGLSIDKNHIDFVKLSSNLSLGFLAGITYPISLPFYIAYQIKRD